MRVPQSIIRELTVLALLAAAMISTAILAGCSPVVMRPDWTAEMGTASRLANVEYARYAAGDLDPNQVRRALLWHACVFEAVSAAAQGRPYPEDPSELQLIHPDPAVSGETAPCARPASRPAP